MPHNMPDDIAMYDNDPRSPYYDDSADRAAEMAANEKRQDMIDCITKGYDTTEDGDTVPLDTFSEYVLDCVETDTGCMKGECRQLILWSLQDGGIEKSDLIKLRREIATHYVTGVEKL